MTNRMTNRSDFTILVSPDKTRYFGFKGKDSYCYHSSFPTGGSHA